LIAYAYNSMRKSILNIIIILFKTVIHYISWGCFCPGWWLKPYTGRFRLATSPFADSRPSPPLIGNPSPLGHSLSPEKGLSPSKTPYASPPIAPLSFFGGGAIRRIASHLSRLPSQRPKATFR
jgi:hypothetical protein